MFETWYKNLNFRLGGHLAAPADTTWRPPVDSSTVLVELVLDFVRHLLEKFRKQPPGDMLRIFTESQGYQNSHDDPYAKGFWTLPVSVYTCASSYGIFCRTRVTCKNHTFPFCPGALIHQSCLVYMTRLEASIGILLQASIGILLQASIDILLIITATERKPIKHLVCPHIL